VNVAYFHYIPRFHLFLYTTPLQIDKVVHCALLSIPQNEARSRHRHNHCGWLCQRPIVVWIAQMRSILRHKFHPSKLRSQRYLYLQLCQLHLGCHLLCRFGVRSGRSRGDYSICSETLRRCRYQQYPHYCHRLFLNNFVQLCNRCLFSKLQCHLGRSLNHLGRQLCF